MLRGNRLLYLHYCVRINDTHIAGKVLAAGRRRRTKTAWKVTSREGMAIVAVVADDVMARATWSWKMNSQVK